MMMRFTSFDSAPTCGWGAVFRLGLASVAILCAAAARAQVNTAPSDQTSPMIGFLEAGVLCAQEGGAVREAPDTVAGTTHVVEEAPAFISTGRAVPAVLGVGFGVRSGVLGDLGVEDVTMTVTHPAFAGSGATEQSFLTRVGTQNSPGITFYQFDYGYELALGEWTMTASVGSTVLYDITFTVVPPSALPELAEACGFTHLIG